MLFITSSFVYADESFNARYYLDRIIEAKDKYPYKGVFNYERPDYKSEIYVHQQINNHGEMQHWVKEKNSSEGFLKVNGQVKCVTKAYSNRFRANSILQSIDEKRVGGILENYDVTLSDKELTIAGLPANELIFKSKENDRYTYRLAFDKQTFIPLQFMFLDNDQKVLERGAFSTFSLLSNERESKPLEHCLDVVREQSNIKQGDWDVSWIPKGFQFVYSIDAETGHYHVVYGDGIVAFSVFIEPIANNEPANIEKHSGATTLVFHKAVGADKVPYLVIVVGEIPAATAFHIASSVRSID